MRSIIGLAVGLLSFASTTHAEIEARDGWFVERSAKNYVDLLADTRDAIKANGLFIVTQAGPTKAAKNRGIEIPGNTVIGAFNNKFAVRVLALSTPAMIEAPIRLYVTENQDGTATLSYKTPSFVFSPYQGGLELNEIASELDAIFGDIAEDALN